MYPFVGAYGHQSTIYRVRNKNIIVSCCFASWQDSLTAFAYDAMPKRIGQGIMIALYGSRMPSATITSECGRVSRLDRPILHVEAGSVSLVPACKTKHDKLSSIWAGHCSYSYNFEGDEALQAALRVWPFSLRTGNLDYSFHHRAACTASLVNTEERRILEQDDMPLTYCWQIQAFTSISEGGGWQGGQTWLGW